VSTISTGTLTRGAVIAAPKRPRRGRWGLIAAGLVMIVIAPVVLLAGAGNPPCSTPAGRTTFPAGGGSWLATAYGPPWGGINGNGITATGINLSAGQPMYEIAVDPAVIPLSSYTHVKPNPFGTSSAFVAGDTGGAILGKHVDIYDWQGRSSQLAWGERHVNVTWAADPGAGNVLGQTPPPAGPTTNTTATTPTTTGATPSDPAGGGCASSTGAGGILYLTPGGVAKILSDGQAEAPASAPRAVKLAIAAGNEIIAKPYVYGGGHGQSLDTIAASYDCSSTVSFALHGAGLLDANPEDSTQLESYGASGPGQWISVYANSGHTWMAIAGIALDTSWSGNPSTWQPPGTGPRWRPDPTGNLADGLSYVVRHPPGL
jgi:3D (Asp-Asp-Asp) domain-containing protein